MTGTGGTSSATVALVGNPNTGKSTLFGVLCGVRQRTGNYPGVTVEKKEGRLVVGDRTFTVIDLPGTYSLAPRSPDEMVAVDVLLGRQADAPTPDAILCIVDASNLERNLYVVSQVLELARPTVIALNMVDIAQTKGITIDVPQLERQLGVPVVPIQAHRKQGIEQLEAALARAIEQPPAKVPSPFPAAFQAEVERLEQAAQQLATSGAAGASERAAPPRYLIERLLLDTTGYLERSGLPGIGPALMHDVQAARGRLAAAGCPVPAVEAMARYQWIQRTLTGVVTRPKVRPKTWSDRVDRVLTHRVGGSLIFVALMGLMFEAVFQINEPGSALIEAGVGWLSDTVGGWFDDGPLRSLLVTGVIGGVGGVIVFLPQIFTLFFFIAILEDCGYMARAAYLMDRLMSRIGLSGKSFIPLLSSFACAIPGIMATRVIENRRDRLVTILVAPLMSCSARLPVYGLLISAFVPSQRVLGGLVGLRSLTMFSMYALGVVAAIGVALVLKKTLLRGATPPFVMELPSYKFPSLAVVLHRMWEPGWSFVRRAGTLICAVSVLVWAAGYYPHDPARLPAELRDRHERIEQELARRAAADAELGPSAAAGSNADPVTTSDAPASGANLLSDSLAGVDVATLEAERGQLNKEIQGFYLRDSYLGRAGKWLEPAVRPLGWDWRIGCAALASFPAREVVVSNLRVIYNLGEEESDDPDELATTLKNATWDGTDRPVFTLATALSLLVFFSLCAQCASTLAVMKRETNSWRWPTFTFVYMTSLAYLVAWITFAVASAWGG